MKKVLLLILILSLLATSCQSSFEDWRDHPLQTLQSQLSQVYRLTFTDQTLVRLNGQPITLSTFRQGDTLSAPLRPLLEACGASVSWDGTNLTASLYDNALFVQTDTCTMNVNGDILPLNPPITIAEDRLVGPVRPLCEALSIGVTWHEDLRILDLDAPLPADRKTLHLNGRTLSLGDSLLSVQTRWGQPDRIDPSVYPFNWHVYNRDYRNFFMVGYTDNRVCAIYTNAPGFTALGHTWGGQAPDPDQTDLARFYTDDHAHGTIHALLFGEGFDPHAVMIPNHSLPLMEAQERESLDLANAFRLAQGLSPLGWDDFLCQSARAHSQDMADRHYFSHTNPEGLEPWERYQAMGGTYKKFGENIYAGHFTALDTHHGWINSQGHRQAILDPDFTHMGVGLAYTPDTQYTYYTTQHFLRPA